MKSVLYDELAAWYRLLDPPENHAEEAACLGDALEAAISGSAGTLLDLGAGAGHNGFYLKERFECTLADLSPPMLTLSRQLNPECEHVHGDMRSLRLGRTFDAVLVHDAVSYMTTEQELEAVVKTAYQHTRQGGVAIFAPDFYEETFEEAWRLIDNDEGQRSLRCVDWVWDPDPTDGTYRVDYALLLREGCQMRSVQLVHLEGLFSRSTWARVLSGVGYAIELIQRLIGQGEEDEVWLCRKD